MSNRYDNGSVSAYTPQSFQELSFVPIMKRQQHDEMSKNIAALDAIATDPLNEHRDEALRLKKEFEGKLGNISGNLASKGIDSIGVGDFYKLKKEHYDLIAPTGRVGQINNSKIIYNKRQEDYIKSAEKENIGRAQALINWKEANKGYTGFSEDGKYIKDVGELGASQYQDYDKQLALKHSLLGETIRGFSNSGHHLEKGNDGGYWEVTKNGERVKSNNAIQVDAAQKAFEDSWLNGEGAKWSKEAGVEIDKNRIDNDFKAMLKYSNVYKENVSANYSSPQNSSIGGSRDGENTNDSGSGKIISGESKIEASSKYDNYSDALNETKTLNSKITSGKGTTADKIRRDELIELRRIADSKMNQIPKYKELNTKVNSELNQWKTFSTKFELSDSDKKMIKDNPNILPQLLFSKGFGSFKGNKNDPQLKFIMDDSKLSSFNNMVKERQSYKDNAWNNSSKVISNYNYIPTTTAEANDFENFNFQAGNILSNVKNIDNILDIVNISQDNDSYSKITPNYTKALTASMKNADPKSFSISNPTPSGTGGRPQVTITFTTKKNSDRVSIDDSGIGPLFKNRIGGDEKTISFVANLKSSKDNPHSANMIGSLSKHLRDYYGGKGDVIPQGVGAGLKTGDHLKNTMIYNQYKGNTVQELGLAAYSTDGITVQMKDEDAFHLLAGKAAKKGMRIDDYVKYYGKEKI